MAAQASVYKCARASLSPHHSLPCFLLTSGRRPWATLGGTLQASSFKLSTTTLGDAKRNASSPCSPALTTRSSATAGTGRPPQHLLETGRPPRYLLETGRPPRHLLETGRPPRHLLETGRPPRHLLETGRPLTLASTRQSLESNTWARDLPWVSLVTSQGASLELGRHRLLIALVPEPGRLGSASWLCLLRVLIGATQTSIDCRLSELSASCCAFLTAIRVWVRVSSRVSCRNTRQYPACRAR
ncbi:hypothetical protein FA95DRAFT_783228 [Auriscalpium vulgare]|uniref:Uncharacterized protein n=1 Tax=Auriscalpium vulgare TaxID=40419 RepID=A0ACB8RAC7_9AGAM|nr:hypothetical protein FA95DRAFT_783228 [Auriscalpium vulgare]